MAKEKKLGIKHWIKENKNHRPSLYLRITYNQSNTTIVSLALQLASYNDLMIFQKNPESAKLKFEEQDIDFIHKLRAFYSDQGIDYQAKTFSLTDVRTRFLLDNFYEITARFFQKVAESYLDENGYHETGKYLRSGNVGVDFETVLKNKIQECDEFLLMIEELNSEIASKLVKYLSSNYGQLAEFISKKYYDKDQIFKTIDLFFLNSKELQLPELESLKTFAIQQMEKEVKKDLKAQQIQLRQANRE